MLLSAIIYHPTRVRTQLDHHKSSRLLNALFLLKTLLEEIIQKRDASLAGRSNGRDCSAQESSTGMPDTSYLKERLTTGLYRLGD